jgi:hypothetical protein
MPGLIRASMPLRLSDLRGQWNGLPEPVPGLDPGIKPGNDVEYHTVTWVPISTTRSVGSWK